MQLGEVGVARSCAESRGLDPWLVPGEFGGPWGSMFPQRAVWSPTVTNLATLCSILLFWQKGRQKQQQQQHTNSWTCFHRWHLPCTLCWTNLYTASRAGGVLSTLKNVPFSDFPPRFLSFFFVFFSSGLQFSHILTYFSPYQCVRSWRWNTRAPKRLHK